MSAEPLSAPVRVPAFVRGLRGHGARAALLDGPTTVTYDDLAAEVERAATALGPVRRLVLVATSNTRAGVVAYLSALAGGHVVLLVPDGDDERLHGCVARYDPDVVVRAGRSCRTTVRRPGTVHDLHPDLALLLSTSGSTGSPKLVRLSYDNLDANAEAIATYLGLADDDRTMTTLPITYCYGLSVLHTHLLRGASVVLTTMSVVDPGFLELCSARGVTSLAGVPYTFDLLDRAGLLQAPPPSLRRLTQAGGRMRPEQVRRYAVAGRRHGIDLYVMYGQTEATARMAYLPPRLAAEHPGAVGVPIPGGSLSVVDADASGIGELVYRGPNVMLGYADGPADLALGRTVRELKTGDLGRETAEGLFEVVGRATRGAKVFGLRLDLARLEDSLAEAGLTTWCTSDGDRLVVLAEADAAGCARTRRRAAAASGLPMSAVRVVGVEQIARSPSGKVDPARAQAQAGRAVPGGSGDVAALYAEVLGCDVEDSSTFVGLGGDSLSYVEVSLRLEELLGGLPTDWYNTPVGALRPQAARAPRQVDTTIVLRALAIMLIVASHTRLLAVVGGAHALIAIAGYNTARFLLPPISRAGRVAGAWRACRRIAVPSVAVIGLASLVTPGLGVAQIALLNAPLGPDVLGPQWRYWFVEVLVALLVGLTLLLCIPGVDRAERRWPLGFPLALLGIGLVTRFDVIALGPGPDRTQSAAGLLWLFALGWCAARVSGRGVRERTLVTAAALLLVPGFFDTATQGPVVVTAVALLIWAPFLSVGPGLVWLLPVAGLLARSSMWIYLTHWQVLPLFRGTPLLGFGACLAVGVGVYVGLQVAVESGRRAWSLRPRQEVRPRPDHLARPRA